MNATPFIVGIALGTVLAVGVRATMQEHPTPVYSISASGISSVPVGSMIDFGNAEVVGIRAWTDGHGAILDFDKVKCVFGVKGGGGSDQIPNIPILRVGSIVHIRGHLDRKTNALPAASFDCETVSGDP